MSVARAPRGAAAFIVVLIALLGAGRSRMLRDPGTFWHIAVGRTMLSTHTLPHTDTLTFTRAGRPWIAQQWLGECIMAGLERAGGLDGVLLAACVVLAVTYANGFYRLTAAGVVWPLAALVMLLVIAASSYHFLARPHLVTLALSGWLYGALCDIDAGRGSWRRVLMIPLVFVGWANLHGGALGGLATLVIAAGMWLVQAIRRSDADVQPLDRAPASRRLLLLTILLCAATPVVSPYGMALPRTWVALMRSDVLRRVIQEHAPPAPASVEFWAISALAVVYIVVLAGAEARRFRLIWLLPLAWAGLSYTRVRHGPIFAVMAPIGMAEMLRGSRWASACARRGSDLLASPTAGVRTRVSAAAVVCVMGSSLIAQAAGVKIPLFGAGWARLDAQYWPVQAMPALGAALDEAPRQANVFNDLLYGGIISYAEPRARIYIDDRCELAGDDGLLGYMNAQEHPEAIQADLDRWDVRLALVRSGSSFDQYFAAKGWMARHRDDTATLYVRDRPRD